ncbi:hypothetical protein Poli38472_008610 [Pythium oligandrum]|uniref:Uncharacterized protein n=1 Tax=Pythium oligandrum TaxID=41045 RepID=A0A8K1C4G8_PYTOL|nr:hypothetical protein Poli38472_008610 [Pythium oligandrum]|eukprot:TMW55962.1 hypothetical protein Poli38472_008610 [Pythium oligandrum]
MTWTSALARVLQRAEPPLALVEKDALVLLRVDAPRSFHPLHAFVSDEPSDESLVLVLRLHPELTTLLQTLRSSQPAAQDTDSIMERIVGGLVWQQRSSDATEYENLAVTTVPFFAEQVVHLTGGAVCLYGDDEVDALDALDKVAMALAQQEAVATELTSVVVVVEHQSGYAGRRFVFEDPTTTDLQPQVYRIHKSEWTSASIANLSLDDALEAYDAAFREHCEIHGDEEPDRRRTLDVSVQAAFEVRGPGRSAASSLAAPPVCLISSWTGIENVRSLLCRPAPQSSSVLCFSGARPKEPVSSCSSSQPRQTLVALECLEKALRSGDVASSWTETHDSSSWASEPMLVLPKFRRFLEEAHNSSQPQLRNSDEYLTGNEPATNNTIESSISVTLDGEHERQRNGESRADLDFVERVWDFVVQHVSSTELVLQSMHEFAQFLSVARVFPGVHPGNDSILAKLVRCRQQELHDDHMVSSTGPSPSFTDAAEKLLANPLDIVTAVIEVGEWKMKRDVEFWLGQTGFSAQESGDFVRGLPRFHVEQAPATSHWKAMEHVLELCRLGRSISLPVASMRQLVHDCVACYGGTETDLAATPALMVELQSFIPERLRANIADPLFWDLFMAFSGTFHHRVRLCQEAFHPSAPSLLTADATPLTLDHKTLQSLRRCVPESVSNHPDVVAMLSRLEQDHETRAQSSRPLFGGMDLSLTAMTRYDCTTRTLNVYP